jgi:hypothetical protein
VPITFTFHKPFALETKPEGTGKPSIFIKHWLMEKELMVVAVTLSP